MLSLIEIKKSAHLLTDATGIVDSYTHLLIYKKWRCFYSLTGDTAPLDVVDSDDLGVPNYIAVMIYKFETAHILLTESFSLKDPLKSGIFADKGVQFFDIFIKNIPREHGIASGLVFDTVYPILGTSSYQAKSLKIVVHNNLIARTATPMHELFHIFQYAYCQFNNMWFMEGLARWCQSIVQVGKGKEEPLPQTAAELDCLLHKLHDAEYFWNRLATLCESSEQFIVPETVKENTEVYNNHKTGAQFIHTLLEQCQIEYDEIRDNRQQREVQGDYWPRHEKRTPNNNQAIFTAIIHTVEHLEIQENKELSCFLALIVPIAGIKGEDYKQPEIQHLFSILYQYTANIVCLNEDGSYFSEFYDIFTQTLTFPSIEFSAVEMTDKDLASFRCVKRINGNFVIKDCPNIHSLSGLNHLVDIKGKLLIEALGVQQINGLNALLQCQTLDIKNMPHLRSINGLNGLLNISGSVAVDACHHLQTITGFNSLQTIYNDLSISHNNDLVSLLGFNSLNCLVKGSLKLESNNNLLNFSGFNYLSSIAKTLWIKNCPKLTQSPALTHLVAVRNIHIIQTNLVDLSSLRNLFKQQTHFKGYIKIINSGLSSVQFMQGLQSLKSSFYLHQNQLKNLKGLEALVTVGGSFSLAANKLTALSVLANLCEINGLLSITNNNLSSLAGLEQLQRLETRRWGENSISLKCYGNPKLTDLSALANISSYDRYLILYFDANQRQYQWPSASSVFFKNIIELHDEKTKAIIPRYKIQLKEQPDYSYFRETTHNKVLTELFDLESNADTLVLSFTGAHGHLGGLFYNKYPLITKGIDTHKIFIMDPTNNWYNAGIQGLTKNLTETIGFLKAIIEQKSYRRVVCMGTSMGAYLSLIVGNLLQVDAVLAFSPQTFLDKVNRKYYGDTRWASLLRTLPKDTPAEFLDLRLFFQQHVNTKTQFYMHYGEHLEIDKAHVEHLPPQANIHRVAYPVNDHYITVMLHKQNKLNAIIQSSLMSSVDARK